MLGRCTAAYQIHVEFEAFYLFETDTMYLCTAYRKMTCSTVWQEYLV